jgi:site-specific recombinase XerD
MGEMRHRMEEELRLRGYAERTRKAYVAAVRRLASYHRRAPAELGPEEIRSFLVHLVEERGLSWSSLNQMVCGLRFFYLRVLGRDWDVEKIPMQRRRKRKLPETLSEKEVAALLTAATELRSRTMLMGLYAAGLRLSELIHLQVGDIDSATMRVRVREAKGGRERYVILAARLLVELRSYFRRYRPQEWLFYGRQKRQPAHPRSVQRMVALTARKAGIERRVTPHVLRHSFTTHLLDRGTSIVYIQSLLGHRHLKTTMGYLRVSQRRLARVASPLDRLVLPEPRA